MANLLRHRFVSAKTDGGDPSQVQPSHWNDGHLFLGGSAGDLLQRDPADGVYGANFVPPSTFQMVTSGGGLTLSPEPQAHYVAFYMSALSDFHGVAPSSGAAFRPGTRLRMWNIGAGPIRLLHYSSSVPSYARFYNVGGDQYLGSASSRTGGSVEYVYRNIWEMVACEQGNAMPLGLTTANCQTFSCSTIFSEFYQAGREVHLRMYFQPAVVAGPVGALKVAGFPWVFRDNPMPLYAVTNSPTGTPGHWGPCFAQVVNSGTAIDFYPANFGTWGAGNYYVAFDGTLTIQ